MGRICVNFLNFRELSSWDLQCAGLWLVSLSVPPLSAVQYYFILNLGLVCRGPHPSQYIAHYSCSLCDILWKE